MKWNWVKKARKMANSNKVVTSAEVHTNPPPADPLEIVSDQLRSQMRQGILNYDHLILFQVCPPGNEMNFFTCRKSELVKIPEGITSKAFIAKTTRLHQFKLTFKTGKTSTVDALCYFFARVEKGKYWKLRKIFANYFRSAFGWHQCKGRETSRKPLINLSVVISILVTIGFMNERPQNTSLT